MSEEEQVRRLLADARHADPIPPDVAARMDRVLADLDADRPVRPAVADLSAARRRRRVRTLLVAAAAVVVAGIGVDQLRSTDLGGGSSAGSGADSAGAGSAADAPSSSRGGGHVAPSPAQDYSSARVVPLDPDRFARQAARIQGMLGRDALDRVTASNAQGESQGSGAGRYLLDLPKSVRCPDPGRGRVVPVRYAGAPGLLVYRPVRGDSQVVDLLLCGHSGTTRTITLPAP